MGPAWNSDISLKGKFIFEDILGPVYMEVGDPR